MGGTPALDQWLEGGDRGVLIESANEYGFIASAVVLRDGGYGYYISGEDPEGVDGRSESKEVALWHLDAAIKGEAASVLGSA